MSDPTSKTQDTPPEVSQNDAIDQSRRKLTGAALGVSAVFTLASRPVWANSALFPAWHPAICRPPAKRYVRVARPVTD